MENMGSMFFIFVLLVIVLFGLMLVNILDKNLFGKLAKIWVAFLLGSVFLVIFIELFCLLTDFYNSIFLSLILMLVVVFYYYKKNIIILKIDWLKLNQDLKSNQAVISVLSVLSLLIIWLSWKENLFTDSDGNMFLGRANYGDTPYHISMITQMAYSDRFPPNNPAMSGVSLVYPYFINIFTAIFVRGGMSLRWALFLTTSLFCISFFWVIYEVVRQVSKNKKTALLALIFFLLGGGVTVWYFFQDNGWQVANILDKIIRMEVFEIYAHLREQNIQWVPVLFGILVPERSLMFGMPVTMIVLFILFFKINRYGWLEILIISLLISKLPMLHTHSALVFVVLALIFFISRIITKRDWKWIKMMIIIFLVSALLFFLFYNRFFDHVASGSNFIKFHIGWMKGNNESLFFFWWKNLSLLIPLMLCYLFIFRKNIYSVTLVVGGLVILFLVNILSFAPWEWDNVKIIFWLVLIASIAVAQIIASLWLKKFIYKLIAIIIFLTIVSHGFLNGLIENSISYMIFSQEQVMVGEWIKNNTDIDSIFATYPLHNSPANTLAGREIVFGWAGYLWTQGVDYAEREADVKKIYSGSFDASNLMNKYHVSYVMIENHDPEGWVINRDYFNRYPVVFESQNYKIYEII